MATDNNRIVTTESFYAPDARILVVDDTRMNLIVITELLKHTGMQIDTADSGMKCLFLTEQNKYHIIFLDIKMPEMDGFETLRRLFAQERNDKVPVIALTASAVSESGDEYIEKGFSDYLSKPIDLKKLEEVILTYLPRELVLEMKPVKRDLPTIGGETVETPEIAGLDAAIGIRSCGTVETFKKALKDFYITASERIREIENYICTENYNDFTIKVHALKSSSRIIGAIKLSEMAEYLEECGNHENIPEIKHKTSDLIEHYRKLTEAIGVYINNKADNLDRPVLEWETYIDALHTLHEFVEAFDFDSADSIMEMLTEYAIPDEYHEAIKKLRVLLIDADRDGILRFISSVEVQAHPEHEKRHLDIQGLDVESALAELDGSTEAYISILKVFTEDEKERLQQMDECIKTENIELYTVYAHSIKSSAAIIGAAELSGLAKQLEMAGKDGDFEYILGNHNELSVKMNNIIETLVSFLHQRIDWECQENKQGSKEFLLENLTKIEKSLMDYEINDAEEFLKRLNDMQWNNPISDMLSKIGQKMLIFDYDAALSLVVKLMEIEESLV